MLWSTIKWSGLAEKKSALYDCMDAGAIAEATAFRCPTFRHTVMCKSAAISKYRNVGHKKHANLQDCAPGDGGQTQRAAQDLPAAFAVGTVDDQLSRHILNLPALNNDLENQRQCLVGSQLITYSFVCLGRATTLYLNIQILDL